MCVCFFFLASVILPFCEAGLIGRLTELAKGENWELVLASLKVLRLTLRQSKFFSLYSCFVLYHRINFTVAFMSYCRCRQSRVTSM